MVATIVGVLLGVACLGAAAWFYFAKPAVAKLETEAKTIITEVETAVKADANTVETAVESDVKKL